MSEFVKIFLDKDQKCRNICYLLQLNLETLKSNKTFYNVLQGTNWRKEDKYIYIVNSAHIDLKTNQDVYAKS